MFIQTTRRRDNKTMTVNVNQIAYVLDYDEGVTAIYFGGGDDDGLHRVLVNDNYETIASLMSRVAR